MKSETPFPKYQPISMFKGMAKGRCPRCRTGKMFSHSQLHPTKFHKMNEDCPHCEFHFEIEPGFWFGAMYVSYAINAAIILIGVLIVMFQFPEWSGWIQVGAVLVPMLLVFPFNFRISRVLYLYAFGSVKYDPKAASPVDIERLDVNFKKKGGFDPTQ